MLSCLLSLHACNAFLAFSSDAAQSQPLLAVYDGQLEKLCCSSNDRVRSLFYRCLSADDAEVRKMGWLTACSSCPPKP